MRLLKIISFFFIFYFIRRFIQLYKTVKEIQATQLKTAQEQAAKSQSDIIEADYKVMDH